MANSKIEWTDRVWNPVTGCTKISEGCQNCYAERMSKRFAETWGLPADNPFGVRLHPERLSEPFKWKKPSRIFVCSMGDLFHDDVPDEFLDKVFAVMAKASNHTFIVLTKRPEHMRNYIIKAMHDEDCNYDGWYKALDNLGIPDATPMQNVWIGVTAENQKRADERIPILLQIPAAVRFVSVEPMLGPVNLRNIQQGFLNLDSLKGKYTGPNGEDNLDMRIESKLNWVICGGESGPGARLIHPAWARSLRDQCKAANVPFFFKQWGEWAPWSGGIYPNVICMSENGEYDIAGKDYICFANESDGETLRRVGKKNAGRELDGQIWDQYPEV